jgi:hypothetical protein
MMGFDWLLDQVKPFSMTEIVADVLFAAGMNRESG